MANPELIKALMVTAEIYGKDFSEAAAEVLASDISPYPVNSVLAALTRCRRELKSFPTIADILARIDDGRPGVEQAWAMVPKDEVSSVVWTEEIREAFAEARHLIAHDRVAARMTFREVYLSLVSDARAKRTPVRWEPSLGHCKADQEAVLGRAIQKGLLSREHVNSLLSAPVPSSLPQIAGPTEDNLTTIDAKEMIAKIRSSIEKERIL